MQFFHRDAKQAEVLLSQQEHLLSKDETPSNLEQAESLIKKHEALLTKILGPLNMVMVMARVYKNIK